MNRSLERPLEVVELPRGIVRPSGKALQHQPAVVERELMGGALETAAQPLYIGGGAASERFSDLRQAFHGNRRLEMASVEPSRVCVLMRHLLNHRSGGAQ